MNCKPGDIAVIVRPSPWLGWIVDVIEAAPLGGFTAPDGTPMRVTISGEWLIKASRPFGVRPFTKTTYAVCKDSALRPIRDPGEDARDETLSWLPVPAARVKETA